jgi:hypothetical protein
MVGMGGPPVSIKATEAQRHGDIRFLFSGLLGVYGDVIAHKAAYVLGPSVAA